MNLFSAMIPPNPLLNVEAEGDGLPARLCLDLESEKRLQNQRRFVYTIGGPAVAIAGIKLQRDEPLFGTFVLGLGIACTLWHYKSYTTVQEVTGIR